MVFDGIKHDLMKTVTKLLKKLVVANAMGLILAIQTVQSPRIKSLRTCLQKNADSGSSLFSNIAMREKVNLVISISKEQALFIFLFGKIT